MIGASNITRVSSAEDIADGRRERITVVLNPHAQGIDRVQFEATPKYARALAAKLNRHANFLDPPKKRRTR